MKPATKLLLSVALGILSMVLVGAFVFALARSQSSQRREALEKFGGEIAPVVVARNDIPANAEISADDVVLKDWVIDLLPRDSFSSLDDVTGQTTKSSILSGEPVSGARLGGVADLSLDIPEGMSAVSFPSQDVLAVGGAVRRGSLVDIFASTGEDAFLLAPEIHVLATSAEIPEGVESASTFGATSGASLTWITVAVSPDQVSGVIRASEQNTLHLVLRGASSASADSDEPSGTTVPPSAP